MRRVPPLRPPPKRAIPPGRRRRAESSSTPATWVLVALLVLVLLAPSPGFETRDSSGPEVREAAVTPPKVSPSPDSPVEDVVIENQTLGNLSSFWGVDFRATEPAGPVATAETSGTPLTFYRWPGGALADSVNMSSGTEYGNHTQFQLLTNESEFVAWCESVECHSIFQVPGEINNSSTAAWEVYYTLHTLGFQPTYWEIGDEPQGWVHFNIPWPEWNSSQRDRIPNATTYARLEQRYIAAMQAEAGLLGTELKFIGLPGEGDGDANEAKWINATVQLDGPQLSAMAIHVYPAGNGSEGPISLSRFFATLQDTHSISARAPVDEQLIRNACPTCAPIALLVDELGSGTTDAGNWTPFMDSYPEVPYVTAELVQAMYDNVSSVELFALNSSYPGSLFSGTGAAHPVDALYTSVLPHFEPMLLNRTLTNALPGTYVAASDSPNDSSVTLLAANANVSASVQLNVSGLGFTGNATYTEWSWNNTTSSVHSSTAHGPDSAWTLPPQGILLVSVCRSASCSPVVASQYPVVFNETGLPAGEEWGVTLNGTFANSTTSSILYRLPNGTYSYRVETVTGFSVSPAAGQVAIAGSGQSVNLTFTRLSPSSYAVTFVETGLANGTNWSVALNGSTVASTHASMDFIEVNGSYTFSVGRVLGYAAAPASGSVVVQGQPVLKTIDWSSIGRNGTQGEYNVSFNETGLPPGISWSVSLGNVPQTTNTSLIVFREPNGSYNVSVPNVSGYRVGGYPSMVTVQGSARIVHLSWSAIFTVTFFENGLPSGANWSVSLNGTGGYSTGTAVRFNATDGQYPYTVGTVSGYVATPARGNVSVTGANETVRVTFAPNSPTSPPSLEAFVVVGVILTAGGLLAIWWTLWTTRRRRRTSGHRETP
jgi:hypothetical protein